MSLSSDGKMFKAADHMTHPHDESGRTEIAFYLPNLEGGGAERAIVAVANHVAALGVTVDLVLGEAVGPYLTEVSPKVQLVNLSSRDKLRVLLSLMRYLRQHRPSVVMSSMDLPNIQMILAAKLTGFEGRTVISQRATIAPVYAEVGVMRRLVYGLWIRCIYRMAEVIISNSRAAAAELVRSFGIPHNQIVTINNQVDIDRLTRLSTEDLSDVWLTQRKAPLIISVGSLTPRKDMESLIRVMVIVRDTCEARLVILGEGSQRQRIEQLVTELDLSTCVYMPGFDVNPYKWMRRADVVVSASQAEGFPNIVAEALALGKRIVATDCPGDTSELLENGRWGRLVPVGDPASMASAILASLDDPNPPDGRIRAADFTPEKTTRAYLDVLLPGFNPRQVPGLKE
jgi:glycosyltransferase involved in cell wall biosynthesis